MGRSNEQGITLFELLAVLSIFSVITGIALPTVGSMIELNRSSTQIHQLYTAIALARSEAVRSGHFAVLCGEDPQCRNRQWQQSYRLFVDHNRNAQLDGDEQLLLHNQLPQGYHWHWSNFRQQGHLIYNRKGLTHALNGTFTLCHKAQNRGQIIINLSGRPRISHEKNGQPCTL